MGGSSDPPLLIICHKIKGKSNMIKTVTLVLHGHFAGKTINLKGTKFINGKVTLQGSENDVDNLSRFLRKNWQAYPEGVTPPYYAELEHAEKLKKEADRLRERRENGADSDDQGDRNRESTELAGSRSGTAGPKPETVSSEHESGADGVEGGDSEHLSSGDGHEDSRVSSTSTKFEDSSSSQVNGEKLLSAMEKLDRSVDGHWTATGRPRIEVVEQFYGKAGLVRRDLDAVWPELNRLTAKSLSNT